MARGTPIIQQGDTDATKFYVLESGTASVLITDLETRKTSHVLTYQPGRCAILYPIPFGPFAGPWCRLEDVLD